MENKDTVTKKNRLRNAFVTIVAGIVANKAFAIAFAIPVIAVVITVIGGSTIIGSTTSKPSTTSTTSWQNSSIACLYIFCSQDKSTPYTPPLPPRPVVVKQENCTTLGRFSKQLTNIAPSDLVVYPNPNETINSFYLQWTNQNLLVANNGGLQQYMQRKLDEIYTGAKLVRLFDGLGPNKNQYMWEVDLPKPLTLQEFSTSVGDAFVKDTIPVYENDPDIDYKRRALCQIEMIQPIRSAVPNVAIVNYDDPSLKNRYSTYRPSRFVSQNDIDIGDSTTWVRFAEQIKSINTDATDVLKMHATYDLVKDKNPRAHVNIAVIDSFYPGDDPLRKIKGKYNGVFLGKGAPDIDVIEGNAHDYNKNNDFPHASQVLFRMAAPSNDGLYNAGVIPNDVLNNQVSIRLFAADTDFLINDERLRSATQVITILGKGHVRGRPYTCFNFFTCFETPPITYDKFSPDIINHSMSTEMSARGLHEQLNLLENTVFYEKYSCGGPADKMLLDSREHKAPIIQSLGNNPYKISSAAINCEQYIIAVGGAIEPSSLQGNNASAYYYIDSSSSWGFKGNYVASRFDALIPINETTIEYVGGTSFSAPVITGTLATLMSMSGKLSDHDFTAPALYNLMVNSSKVPMKYTNEDPRKNNLQAEEKVLFINSDCVFRYFLRNALQFKDAIIKNENEVACKGF